VNHYEVLGVPRTATAEEVRRAYLELARRHHPDFHAADGPGSVREAERRMRAINEAWSVLGDRARRDAYDRSLVVGDGGAPVGAAIRRPSSEFRPFHEVDEDDDDAWRYEPDEGDPASAPPRALLMAPPTVGAIGLLLLFVSLPARVPALTAVGVMCLVAAALLFVGAPVVALFRSQITEERARRRR
jgi:hypothetical protein